jgi:hypothetical protein
MHTCSWIDWWFMSSWSKQTARTIDILACVLAEKRCRSVQLIMCVEQQRAKQLVTKDLLAGNKAKARRGERLRRRWHYSYRNEEDEWKHRDAHCGVVGESLGLGKLWTVQSRTRSSMIATETLQVEHGCKFLRGSGGWTVNWINRGSRHLLTEPSQRTCRREKPRQPWKRWRWPNQDDAEKDG